MTATPDFRLIAILRIAQLVSAGQEGLSMRAALTRTGYATHRSGFGAAELTTLLRQHPSLVDEWLGYSQDKRTAEGWYVLPDGEIGQLLKPATQRSYASIQEAVAQFVISELDFWAGQSG